MSQRKFHMIGEHILQSLTREMDDTERIYNYKLLLKFFENCIDKVNPSFLKKYCAQICKE